MKTLYININNELIQSNEELEVLNYDLDSDFFFYLGEKIAKGCKVENENALITDFNTQDAAEDYQQIIAQWNEIKAILFSEECDDDYEFKLPAGYIHWLMYHPQYNSVYYKNFSQGESGIIYIDLEELYEESVESMQRRILRKLQRDDLYRDIDGIVINDDAVTRKSSIVCAIKEKYERVGFKVYKKWLQDNDDRQQEKKPTPPPPIGEKFKLIKIINYDFSVDYKPSCGYCVIEIGEKYGVINANGDLVVPCKYDYIRSYSEGLFAVCTRDDKWGYIDIQDNVVIPFIYDNATEFCNGLACVCKDNHWMGIDKYGRSTFVFECESLYNVPGYFVAKKDNYYIIMDEKGRTISKISMSKYKYLHHERNNYFHVTSASTGLEGMINSSGKEIISCRYQNFVMIGDNILSARYNNKWGFININDNVLYPFKNDSDSFIRNGRMYVRMQVDNFYKNSNTNVYECDEVLNTNLLTTLYKTRVLWVYKNNLIEAKLLDDKKGLLNEFFEIVLPFEYEYIYNMKYQNRFLVRKNGVFQIVEIIQ